MQTLVNELNAGQDVLVVGPPGTGKTEIILATAKACGYSMTIDTEEGPQSTREIESDVVPHLALIDPRQVVLDGIFGGDDLCVGSVEEVQSGIERGCFSGARRACHQQDAVGSFDKLGELIECVVGKPELFYADLNVVLIQ